MKFQQASQIDSRFSLIAKSYARAIAAHTLIEEGEELAEQEQLAEALVKFQQAKKIDAQSQAKQIAAQVLIQQGKRLARDGEIEKAVTTFKQALEYNAQLEIDPNTKAKQIRADQLMKEGRKLVKDNQIEAAIAQFQQALEFDPNLDFDPNAKVQEVQNPTLLVEKGQQLARQGKIEKALASYGEARTLGEEILAFSWYRLCWYGSLYGQVVKVMKPCNRAVALEADNGLFRDSRGVARVLLKDFNGAIADFQFVVEHAIDDDNWKEIKSQRQDWIAALQQGQNPLTPEVLKQLLEESDESIEKLVN